MKLSLPLNTSKLVDRYTNLVFGKKKIACPYFQNVSGKRFLTSAFSGKGLPKDIEKATRNIFLARKTKISNYTHDVIRFYMVMSGIGIDCSGFVTRIMDCFLHEKRLDGIHKIINPRITNPAQWLRLQLRPIANLSANTISSNNLCNPILDLNLIKPGDLIRFGNYHVAIITEVYKTAGKVDKITYFHSTYDYHEQHGVRKGQIIFNKPNKGLEQQNWTESLRGQNWSLQDYLLASSNNRGVRRLKILI